MIGKKGIAGKSLTDLLLWILFIVLAGFSVWFLFKKLNIR